VRLLAGDEIQLLPDEPREELAPVIRPAAPGTADREEPR
jgi:hypothetical protein